MIKNIIVVCDNGQRWKVCQAKSLRAVCNEIDHARATGSVGGKTSIDRRLCGGSIEVLADVVQIKADGSERKPYDYGE